MTFKRDPESEVPNSNFNELTAAWNYLQSQSRLADSVPSLGEELSTVVALLVPEFANEASIDCFRPGGMTQRFAMYASDELVFTADQQAPRDFLDRERILKLPLSYSGRFVGAMLLTRSASSRPFSEDERVNAKLLTSLIASRIAAGVTQSDCNPPDEHPVLVVEPTEARLHQLCGVLSHELRNPLSVFQTAVDLMESDGSSSDPLHEVLKLQTERMTHLVDDLLDMSRCLNGKTRLKKNPVSLKAIVDAAMQSMQSTLADKQQRVETHLPSHSVWIDGDRFRLTQVLINLISNASKFSDNESSIGLEVCADGDYAELHVWDQGIGIDPSDLPTLFEFFSQSQSRVSLDHSSGGLGIGLGLVKSLIEMHDGSVTAHSDGKGKGSTFIVRLPVCSAPVHTPVTAHLSFPSACKRVLIVDDRRDNEYILKALVKKLGADETRSATDGPSALAVLDGFQPDLILLDIGLQGMSGLELAREIRKLDHCRDIFLVAVTGYDDAKLRQQAELAGIDLYRLKPASMEMLDDVFRRVAEKAICQAQKNENVEIQSQ